MNITKSMEIIKRDEKVVASTGHLTYFPLVVNRYEGCYLYDQDDNQYIDMMSSASCMNLGGGHPAVQKAIIAQSSKFIHYTAAYCYNELMVEYAERLTSIFPGGGDIKICMGNSGSDANDAAIKFSRAFTGRSKIISFHNAYHGSTFGASSLSNVTTRMRKGMGPFLSEVYHFPFWGIDKEDQEVKANCLKDMQFAFDTEISPSEVAAVIIEPIQGDGGLIPAHPEFMRQLYELCQAHGILLISEEVQMGFYRTGKWFGIQHYDVVPDGIILGKAAGGGLPLGGFMARGEIMDSLPAPAHLFTFSGNPIACAAGIAQFDVMAAPDFHQEQMEISKGLVEEIEKLQGGFPDMIQGYQGLGMSYGIVLRKGGDSANRIVYRCFELGLVLISVAGNVLRIQPPLIIQRNQLADAFGILAQAIEDEQQGRIPEEVLEGQKGW